MATNSGVCHNDPNFAVICSFLDRYCEHLALPSISYAELESWIEETKRVNPNLRDLHIRMLRRTSKKCSNVTAERWEKALVKFCHKYSTVDAWELERLSYKYCKISTKLRLLKNLLECQFDTNMKFKDKINEMLPEDMRVLPVGRDKHGLAYWYMLDKSLNLRIYRESLDDVDSETWELVCRDRDDLAKLIENLEKGDHPKLEKSDLSDASFKSEPVSDFNEDSKDSFTRSRSCTPIKPSPLTIKPEPNEEDENESVDEQKSEKLTMKLKIPKIESDSPSKRLKDKFEKEKGHEIKKKCKLKYEEDEENNEKDNEKRDSLTEKVEDESITSKTEVTDQLKETDEKSEGEIGKKAEGENDKKSENENEKTERKSDEVDGIVDNEKEAVVLNVKDVVNESKGLTSDTDKESVTKEEVKQTDSDSKDTNTVSDADKRDEITSENKDELTSENTEQCQRDTENNSKFENETDKTIASDSPKFDDTSAINVDKSSNQTETKLTDAGCDNTLSNGNKEASNELLETISDTTIETQDNGLDSKGDHDIESESVDAQVESSDKQSESPAIESKISTNEECKTDEKSDVIQEEEKNNENKSENSQDVHKDDAKIENLKSPEENSEKADNGAGTPVRKTSDDQEEKQSEALVVDESQKNESLSKITESEVCENTAEQKLDLGCENETNAKGSNSAVVKADDIEKPEIKNEVLKTPDNDEISSTEQSKENVSDNIEKSKEEISEDKTDQDQGKKDVSTKEFEQPPNIDASKKAADDFSKQRGNFMGAFEKFLNPNADTKDSKKEQVKDKVLGSEVESKGACDASGSKESKKQEETTETATSKRQTKVAVRKLTKKTQEKTVEDPETQDDNKDEKSENDSSSDSSDEDSSTSITSDDVPLTKMKGLLAHSRLNRGKALKRQAEESPDESPVEPVSKRSRVRGHVTSKTRSKRQPQVSESSDSSSASDSDDVPLSRMSRKERKAPPRKQTRPEPSKKSSKQKKKHPSDEEFKSKAVKSKGGKPKEIKPPVDLDPSSNLSEEDTGIRRSARVRSLRSRKKKEPSPDFVPSEIEDFIDESETDDEFVVKSKRKKKKLIEFEEEMPKGRNAQRLEAKAKSNNKSKKPIVEEPEDDKAACCKCLKSNQPEWILLCDKCDAGYHTACLRPPLMMIPDGDWFCPPCEHGMLIAKLQENLQTLDTTLLKSDRLVRRKERLAFVGISLDNIIKEEERHEDDVGDNSDADSESRSSKSSNSEGSDKSSSESSSDSSESSESQSRYPRRERARLERRLEKKARRRERKEEMRQSFIKRSCRSKNPISYKFEEYDELIMDAIQEDMSIPKEPKPKKVKPPGISRGKDMSNILGVSDEEEKKTKKPKKRRPRLTELDETDEGEDDTDDYHVSLESSATEVSAGSEGVVESGSDFSDDMYNRRRRSRRRGSRRTRKSGRKRRGCSKYDDFVVESDYESEDDTGRRSTRRKSARRPVNYREFNSDESEVKADEDDSFHTSDVGSDVGKKKKLRSEKDKKKRKHNESSEDWSEESDSDGKPSSKKKERKPSRKKKYDSGESDSYSEDSESEDRPTRKTAKKGKKNEELEKSESGEEENVKTKPTGKKKAVIESDSENESKGQDENVEKDEQENEISEVNIEGNEKKATEKNISEAEKKEMIEKLIDEGSETEVSEGDWEEVDINSGSDKGGKMKSPKRKASPARGGTSPKKGASSPKKESPAKKGAAAKKGSGSPKKRSTSPKKGGKKGSASPEKALTSPVQSSEEVAETVPKEGENVGEASVTEGSEQVPAKPKAARKPRAPAKPRAAGKNARKRKSTETPSDNVNIDPETKLASTEPVIESSVSEAIENTEKETENVSDTSIIPPEPSVSDTSSLNLSHTDDLNKSEEQPDFGSGPELNDSKQETTPEGIPMKRKRTRRTKAQMEIFKKEEEVEIQKMVAQGIPEDVARRRRKSMHKRASLLRSRSQSLEQAPPMGGVPEPIDFLSDENVGIHIKGDVPRSEGDLNINVASDIRNRHLSDHQMKPNETALTNVNNGEKPVDTTATENIKVEIGSDNAVKKDAEKVGDTKVYDEKRDDSPLSARRDYNNAPVGIVKPEVRQGVIVENRQVMDNMRSPPGPSGRAPGAGMVSPLQGMKDMTMGKVGEQGGIQPPNMPPGYQNRGNTEGFRQPQPNYPGFQPQQGPYVPSQQQPYQQGAPHRPYPYGDQQGPMSPTNYPPNSQYMSPNMPPGPQGYYPGPYRGPMGPGMEGPQSPPTGFSGYGPPGSQNFPPQGPYSQGFQSPTGPYQGQMQGPSPQGPMQGPHPGPSGPMNYPPNMQGGYPHAPQPHYPTPHSMQYPQNAPPISPNQPIRPQAIPASHPSPAQPDNQTVRPPIAGVPPRNRRGFMMDNILKPSSSSSGSQDGEPADEINDIVNYVANDEYFKEH